MLADLIVKRHLTTMNARQLVKEDDPYYCENSLKYWKSEEIINHLTKQLLFLELQ